ncbi:PepSY-associated TM helix domain-containing protein [Alkanindiges illinoisensis]|uniref:PepSY-associated TM helix domain-containing protein n=1 Tax=Alkanindiges illinoisensis TaxID=197183 RepID=UPI00068599F6|nr:PepSY-associated TM helix domain-containing protein [Alkanindiges illinoisensis]
MKNGFRQSMAWLHTWTGLVLGWVLFAIFATGTSAYFKEEISQWMTPELQLQPVSNQQAALVALNSMQKLAPDAKSWYITLPDQRQQTINVYWSSDKGYDNANLNPQTGEKVAARDTRGGEFFYRFHFELFGFPVLIGRIIVGIAAMLMFMALITGVITHKKIIADFFTFRPRKGQRSWLDFHNVSSVMSLPFFIMITYTGLAIFFYIYMPWGMVAKYGNERNQFFDEMNRSAMMPEATGKPESMLAFDKMLKQADQALQGQKIARIEMSAPNDQSATVSFVPAVESSLNIRVPGIQMNAINGTLLSSGQSQSAMAVAAGTVYGLHMAHVADWPMRWLLFCSGILGCCMIGSGMVLWTVKRRMQQQKTGKFHVGHYLVERFNVAAIVGLPTAMASYFMANRLINAQLENRADLEIRVFFIIWLSLLIHALLRPWAKAWKEQLFIAGLVFAAIPVINLVITPQASLLATVINQQWSLAGFDLTMLVFAALFWMMLGYLIKNQDQVVARMQQKIERRAESRQQAAALKLAQQPLTPPQMIKEESGI